MNEFEQVKNTYNKIAQDYHKKRLNPHGASWNDYLESPAMDSVLQPIVKDKRVQFPERAFRPAQTRARRNEGHDEPGPSKVRPQGKDCRIRETAPGNRESSREHRPTTRGEPERRYKESLGSNGRGVAKTTGSHPDRPAGGPPPA